jgi:hypothetical protein
MPLWRAARSPAPAARLHCRCLTSFDSESSGKKKKETKKVHFCFFSQRVIGVVLLRDFGMLHMR